MKSARLYIHIFVRLILLVLIISLGLFIFEKGFRFLGILTLLVFVFLSGELYIFISNLFGIYDKTVLSILQNDYSVNFPDKLKYGNYRHLYRLYEKQKATQHEQQSIQLIYNNIFNDLDSGIVILRKHKDHTDWDIFLTNNYFSSLFNIPKYSKWHYLKDQLPGLAELIESNGFREFKSSIDLRIENKEIQSFVLQTSGTYTNDYHYYTILFDSIQRVIERKEKQAWLNLMQIISHELMNSITPIKSLSQNLNMIVRQDTLDDDDVDDIRQSVSTIVNRTEHLQLFIDNYRKLTELPSPVKKPVPLGAVISNCLDVMAPLLKEKGINVVNEVKANPVILADKNLIEQVIINLLTNSIYALEDKPEKTILLSLALAPNRIFLNISDTGKGIEKEIRDKIFLPFFTTRSQGAGIGLTLSKSIIEAHGGYLTFDIEEGKTNFILCFVE